MRLFTGRHAFRSLQEVAVALSDLARSVATSWNVEHDDGGAHVFGSEAVPFDAANFFGAGGMTWTVTAGEVRTHRYARIGRQFRMTFEISSSTVGGSANSNLRIRIPNQWRARGRHAGTFAYVDNGTPGTGVWIAVDESDQVQLFRDYTLSSWDVSGSDTSVVGSVDFEVQ